MVAEPGVDRIAAPLSGASTDGATDASRGWWAERDAQFGSGAYAGDGQASGNWWTFWNVNQSARKREFTWGAHPTGSISGPTAVAVNTNASFSVSAADANANLSAIQVLRASTSGGAWTSLGQLNCSGGSCAGNVNWTPTATGSYFVTLNVSDTVGLYCTGNFNNGKDPTLRSGYACGAAPCRLAGRTAGRATG